MRLSVNISTSKEVKYPEAGSDEKPKALNKLDLENQNQNVNFQVIGFNYTGSLQPLADIVNAWIKEKMEKKVR